jgi:hypothetical protein
MSERIYADPHKTDGQGRLLLTTLGTKADLDRYGVALEEGMHLDFYTDDANDSGNRDDLLFSGVVFYNAELKAWVASIDWGRLQDASDFDAV